MKSWFASLSSIGGVSFTVSPYSDGRYYLFNGDATGDGQYWSVNDSSGSSSSEPTVLTTFGSYVWSLAPSPFGNTIYATVEEGLTRDIFRWDFKPNHIPSVLYPELKADELQFSRDGKWIAYSHRAPTGYELWRARADGTERCS
jgi:Tol biopolymer transport system component